MASPLGPKSESGARVGKLSVIDLAWPFGAGGCRGCVWLPGLVGAGVGQSPTVLQGLMAVPLYAQAIGGKCEE